MIPRLRKHVARSRTDIVAGLCAFVIAQTIGLAHVADASLHANGEPCQICQAIGHAAAAPTPAAAPVGLIQFIIAAICTQFIAAVLRPTFSSHAPRAPPTFL